MRSAFWLSFLMIAGALGGCLDDEPTDSGDGSTATEFDVTNPRSVTLQPGPYEIHAGLDIYLDVPLDVLEGGQALNPAEPPRVHLGLFLPAIPGCDFGAISDMGPGTLPGTLEGGFYETDNPDCRVPIIADVGPYYVTPGDEFAGNVPLFGEGDVPAAERGSGRLGEWLISNFVPHGYGVAQVSVFGSGLSNHCFDVFGGAEQLGVHHAVEFLGAAPYSNGNVGLIGRSYDGSTPWMAAAHGSEYLKTIVPISGLSGLGDLVTWNGASEARIATFQNVIYGRFGLDSNQLATDAATQASCPDWTTAAGWGALGYASGDDVVDAEGTYWEERHFIPRALANYDGSLFMIHGLQDDNVDPHAGWMGELALRDKGNDVKALWGQWYHSYPDRISEHGFNGDPDSIRMDWAQIMLEWFDHYLMGTGPKPVLDTEIQQENGPWRREAVWPPEDAIMVDLTLGEGSVPVGPTQTTPVGYTLNLGPLSETEGTVLGGFSTVTLDLTPSGPGGQIYIELRDGTANKDFGLSYGIGEIRQLAGESEAIVPGQTYTVTMPLQLFDAELPAGHELHVYLADSGNSFLPSPVAAPVNVDLSNSVLHLSTLERDDSAYFQVPIWYTECGNDIIVQQGTDCPE